MAQRPQRRAVARARSILAGLTVAGLAGLALLGADVTAASAAAPTQTTFADQTFRGTSAGDGWVLPSTPSAAGNSACLTAGASGGPGTGSIPACGDTADDAGSGALRLTSASQALIGAVGAVQAVPTDKGLDASFTTYQYDGSGADGMVFYLAATDPYNPAVPTRTGYTGGALGYAAYPAGGVDGLEHAYLGVGLDTYGGFAGNYTGCVGDQSRGGAENSVTVRGPGNGSSGYCVQSVTRADRSLRGSVFTDRSEVAVPVEVVVNPTASALTARRYPDVSVPAGQYAVVFTSVGGARQVVTGALPELDPSSNVAGIDPSWIDPATGYPYKLTYGFTAGTGGATDVHEVTDLVATTAAGAVPVLTARTGGATSVAHAGSGTVTVTPTISADGGSETRAVRTTTTFPTGVTPSADGATGTGWTCSVSGQVVTCEQAAADRAPGTDLPELTIPFTVTGTARTATVSTVVSSIDAEAITVTRDVTVAPQTTVVTVEDTAVTVGDDASLRATVSSSATTDATVPTGTVRFTDAQTGAELCTADLTDGTASCTVPATTAGGTVVTAAYLGDADHATAEGTGSLVVSKVPTVVTATSPDASEPVAAGAPVTLTVDGPAARAGQPAPTGTVEFREGDRVLCAVTLPVTSCDVAGLGSGRHRIVAVYSGDAVYAASTSDEFDVTVAEAVVPVPTPAPTTPAPAPTTAPTTPAPAPTAAAPSSAPAGATPSATPTAAAAPGGLAFTGPTVALWTGIALAVALLVAGVVLLLGRRTRAARG
ncbi:Ig-like domain repeat protein [Curtobacterium sp. RHCKG23]|uniref:Ig-like domain repeat protein n=1 Tax=Curtobacterium citri TaxID=3055139 RepID=A0ABT7T8B3_9MICO|nr:Ig-like domain repeat protein [Curtobacterium citri]MDM7885798.1 Ig-like domain repeat protein [Curtobacterium citri]